MTLRIDSVDGARRGYLRQRFVRALGASYLVLIAAALITLAFASFFNIEQWRGGDTAAVFGTLAALPLYLGIIALLLVATLLAASFAVGIVESLHRRIAGVAGLLLFAALALVGGVAFTGAIDWIFHFLPADNTGIAPDAPHAALLAALFLFTVWIGLEGIVHNWWQIVVPDADYLAVRGWRAVGFRPLSTLRRHLGLPAYVSNFGRQRTLLTVLYFLVAVLNTGIAILLFLPVALFPSGQNATTPPQESLRYVVFFVALLALNLLGAGRFVLTLADRRATKVYQGVREWDDRPPVIFLRSFDQDAERLAVNGRDPLARWPAGVGRARTFDEMLLEHASPYGPVIAIGDPRDPIPPLGAARIFVAEEGRDWQGVVRQLADAARLIVICPNTSAGVRWELDLVAQPALRAKTVFLAHPELPEAQLRALFASVIGEDLPDRGLPVATYPTARGWRVLTASDRSLQSYVAALNVSAQDLFGAKGVPLMRRPKSRNKR